jgi:O-methyltransferase
MFKEKIKNSLPSGLLSIIRRSILLKKIFFKRNYNASIPFNNPIDLQLLINPLENHILAKETALLEQVAVCAKRAAMTSQELINLLRLVETTAKLPGEIAEVGVFKGGSAKLIGLVNKGNKIIHLFDTFQGIPEVTNGIDVVPLNSFSGNLNEVKEFLPKEFINYYKFHVGYFPETTTNIHSDTRFSLVNLDMDTYLSTKKGLEYFYPLMVTGGIIIGHDYYAESCPGVKKAFDEFIIDKPESLIGLWHSQVLFVKI